jgi:hypothetical protein
MSGNYASDENPFCSRRIRPGAAPFLFPQDYDADALVERLRHNNWRGEITGPHGGGKSSLVAALMPALEKAGKKPLLVELHDGQRRLPIDLDAACRGAAFELAIIDGYEQLGWLARWKLSSLCRRRGWGLLVTAHASVGLPPICEVAPTPELAARIVAQLAGGGATFSPAELGECFARHGGNLREMLFELYDVFERGKQ